MDGNEVVTREQVRALLYVLETPGTSVEVSNETLAALCRTWLAVQDAPVLEAVERGWREGGPNDAVVYEVPTELVGQRVRIVPYADGQPEPPQ